MTIVDTIADEHYRSRRDLAFAFAAALNEEARELEAIGIDVVQFDEPAFNVYMREVADWGIAALEAARQGLRCKTAVHICYGYGIKANIDWKETLGSEWRQYEETFPLIARSSIDQVSLECRNSHVPLELIRAARRQGRARRRDRRRLRQRRDAGGGRRDHSRALKFVAPEKLYPCTNCGMAPMRREIAYGKLAALAAGAHLVRDGAEAGVSARALSREETSAKEFGAASRRGLALGPGSHSAFAACARESGGEIGARTLNGAFPEACNGAKRSGRLSGTQRKNCREAAPNSFRKRSPHRWDYPLDT